MKNPFSSKSEKKTIGDITTPASTSAMLAKSSSPKLQNKAFQNPDDLCGFVNENEIRIVSINTTDRLHIIYYYE